MFRNFRKWSLSAITLLFLSGSFNSLAQGGDLFKVKCATCHQVFKDGTGPKLFEVRQKWKDGGALDGSIYQWVNDFDVAIAKDPYAASVATYSTTNMNKFPDLSKEQINSIFDWIDSQKPKETGGGNTASTSTSNIEEKDSSTGWIWLILGIVFATIIVAIGGVRRQLQSATAEAKGEEFDDNKTFGEEIKEWGWNNRKKVVVGAVIALMALVVALFLSLYSIGVVEDYHPSQPITFNHQIHAGTNGIDCRYCHNTVTESKTAGIPTVNVCMNCHKQISGSTPEQEKKIAKIYDAAGFIPEGGGKYTGKTHPIVWNKVHNLPDHVYFNHSQHVEIGGVDCKQCHGDMTQRVETAKVQNIEDLNKVEGNIKLTKPTLTMGWCIECHQEKEVSMGPLDTKKDGYYDEIHKRLLENDKSLYSDYLEDGKVTVKELGGWECAKCHY